MPSSDPDPDDYNPAGPVRMFMAKVQFVNAGPMPPMKIELPMPEDTADLVSETPRRWQKSKPRL